MPSRKNWDRMLSHARKRGQPKTVILPHGASQKGVPRPANRRPHPIVRTPAAHQPFWRKEDPVFDGDGRLVLGGMFEHQRKWWDLPNFIKVLVAGYGAGKTMVGAKWAIASALHNAPAPVGVVSPTFPLARHTTIATIRDLLVGKRSLYGAQLLQKENKSSHEFDIKFKGRHAKIIVYSGEDPSALVGPNLGSAWLDEPFLMQEQVFKQMIARVRHPDARVKEIRMTGTPEQLNWGYDLCMGETQERHDVGLVQASTRANLSLDPLYVGRLLGAFTNRAADAFVDGQFVNLSEGTVYYAFKALGGDDSNVQNLPIPETAELGVGMDFNVNPFAFVVFWFAAGHIHVFDEYELPNADTQYACTLLRQKYVDDETRETKQKLHTVYPDASGNARRTSSPHGKTDFNYITEAGFEVDAPAANPLIRDRENIVNGRLRPVSGPVCLTVSPKCKKLIKALSVVSHENKNTAEQKAMSHILDAFGYPVARKFPVSRAIQVRMTGG